MLPLKVNPISNEAFSVEIKTKFDEQQSLQIDSKQKMIVSLCKFHLSFRQIYGPLALIN